MNTNTCIHKGIHKGEKMLCHHNIPNMIKTFLENEIKMTQDRTHRQTPQTAVKTYKQKMFY